MAVLKKFIRDRNGAISMMTGLLIPVVAAVAGGTMDMARHMEVVQRSQNVLDHAVMNVAPEIGQDGVTEDDLEKWVKSTVASNLSGMSIPFDYTISDVKLDDESTLIATLDVETKMIFGAFIGFPFSSTVLKSGARMGADEPVAEDHDVMLVVDNTYSLGYQDLTRLRDAALGLVEYLDTEAAATDTSTRMGIVPFARYVNVSGFKEVAEPSIDFDNARNTDGGDWLGCVHPYYDDRDSELALGDLLEAGYEFDEKGDRARCLISPITPMTSAKADLDTALRRLPSQSGGSTYIPSGLSWGRRMMQPDNAFVPHAVNDAAKKTLVLFSDGGNALYWVRDDAESDAQTVEMCKTIKGEGTRIIVVAFALDETETRDAAALQVLKSCASDAESMISIEDRDALKESFGELGKKIVGKTGKTRPILAI